MCVEAYTASYSRSHARTTDVTGGAPAAALLVTVDLSLVDESTASEDCIASLHRAHTTRRRAVTFCPNEALVPAPAATTLATCIAGTTMGVRLRSKTDVVSVIW